jgi:two-component system LytT family response regulator
MPVVIFVTAFDEFALGAFERHALDYVLKPIDPERFRRTVRRALDWIQTQRRSDAGANVLALLEEVRRGRPRPERLVVKTAGRVFFLRIDEIRWIAAAGNYVEIHAPSGPFLLRKTLGDMEAELDPRRFLRIHRSCIVAVDRVREIRPEGRGDGEVLLDDGTALPMSRSYRERINELLGRFL